MTHEIRIADAMVEVVHTGDVGYRERLQALEEVHAHPGIPPGAPILIDFHDATLLDPRGASDALMRERTDYMAQAITHPFFEGRRVAIVNTSHHDVRPAVVAAAVRRLPCRVFDSREAAIAWLLAD